MLDQEKLELLAKIDLLASEEPGALANPALIDLFADFVTNLSGLCSDWILPV